MRSPRDGDPLRPPSPRWPARRRAPRCGAPTTEPVRRPRAGEVPDKPSKPVTLNILDVAGNLQLTQGMIDEFVEQQPRRRSRRSPTRRRRRPSWPARSRPSRTPDRVDIDLVLTGTDGLAAGIEQDLWHDAAADVRRPPHRHGELPGAAPPTMQELAGDYGVTVTYYPSGPLLEYLPGQGAERRRRRAEELLAWAKANPGKFQYARPGQLRPGPHLPDGPALHPRRQGPEGPDQRLGQDLGLPQGARQVRRLLPVRHRPRR